ncbi:MAG: PAS domain-containing sensor histidine kinase [Granulosicoccus sp.]
MTVHRQSLVSNDATESVNKPDWAILRLLNQYRLLILLALTAVYYLDEDQRVLGSFAPPVFLITHLGYLLVTLTFVYLTVQRKPCAETQFYLQHYLDIVLIVVLMFASGGVNSGIGALLLVNLALFSQLSSVRYSLLFAAIASMLLITEELLLVILLSDASANFEATALFGALLFLVAWLMTVPLRHLLNRQLVSPSFSRAILDAGHIAQLNEEIIRELDSGVLVTDMYSNVILINDTARILLAAELVKLPVQLKQLSNELTVNLSESNRSPTLEIRSFDIPDTGSSVLPHYIHLSSGGTLIRLDDHTHIRTQFQQLKLASLGRLSASIAHEIRNPLGAIHHAIQLIEESNSLQEKDVDLLKIARRHADRINRIVEDVLQLSNRQLLQSETVAVDQAVKQFIEKLRKERHLTAVQVRVDCEPCTARVDAGHLDQILWNLCDNACQHGEGEALLLRIRCKPASNGNTILEVIDNGRGVPEADRDKLFEPFYSTHHHGTGLGLFIVRELCEMNKALIECLPGNCGAHFRITFANAQDNTQDKAA